MSALLLCVLLGACGGGSEAEGASAPAAPMSQAPGSAAFALPAASADEGSDAESTPFGPSAIEALLLADPEQSDEASDLPLRAQALASATRSDEPEAAAGASQPTVLMPRARAAAGAQETHAPGTLGALGGAQPGPAAADRLAHEDWPGLQARMATTAAVAKWIADQSRRVDAWILRDRERADLVGGWIHDYVDARTGAPMAWKEDTPEPPASADAAQDLVRQAWVTHMRQRNIAYAQTAARLFRATGQQKYADWAMRQLDFYAENYARWPLRLNDGPARMFRNGLSEAVNVFTLLDTARLLAGTASAARQEQWASRLFRPIAENQKSSNYPMTNIGLWHQAAIAAVAMRLRDESLLEYALTNAQGLRAIIATGLTSDQIWIEGSLGYNAYVIECLAKLLVHASLEGYAARLAPEWETARHLLLAPLALAFDDGALPTPGDATSRLKAAGNASFFQLFRLVPTYWGSARANASLSWEALLDPASPFPEGAPRLPQPATRDFPAVRMAVLRAGAWQAFVHYGQAVSSHAQHEALNFELYDGRTPITTDAGTVIYSSPYHTNYFRRAAAHNVPMIDGQGQTRWRPGTVLAFDAAQARLLVSQPDYNPRAAVTREYRTSASGFASTTEITLKGAAGSARLGEAFHTDCAIAPLQGLWTMGTQPLPSSDAMSYWRVDQHFSAGSSWSARLQCGATAYRLQVEADGMQRVFMGTAPTTPLPQRRQFVYFETTAPRATFRMTITALP